MSHSHFCGASSRIPFLLSILYAQIIFTIPLTNTQIELTPSSISSLSDITVTPGEGCDVIDDAWSITVTQQAGADLTISLGSTYGFHADYASTISITLNGNTPNPDWDCDMFLIFAVNDFYFAHFLRLDDIYVLQYRECPASSNPLIARNVTDMIINNNKVHDRYYRFCNDFGDWSVVSPKYKAAAQWPMNIVIHNNPNTNTVEYTWSDATVSTNGQVTSTYYSSFDTEQGLDVYIAGDNTNEHFIITSIDINYQYTVPPTTATQPPTTGNPTTSIPTASPSLPPPTTAPTTDPTPDPTSHPTTSPTTDPTPDPTSHSTTSPTEPPSTSIPSKSPTNKPITKAPTMDLAIPTETVSPSELQNNSTNSVVAISGVMTSELSSADQWYDWGYVIVGSVMMSVGIVCGIIMVVVFKKRQHRASFSPIVPEMSMNGHQAVANADVSRYLGSAHQFG